MNELGVDELLAGYKNGSIKVTEYAQRAIRRIDILKSHNFFTTFDPESLLAKAAKADAVYKEGAPRALEGILVGVKDNIAITGQQCSGATKSLWGLEPKETSAIMRKLFDAGAIDAARTNMHELAYGPTSDNQFVGPCRNFNHIDYNCGGSSGGSAGAAAADIFPVCLGTDTCGSVRIPANNCGVFGYRPSTGAWPNDYGLKMTHRRDVCGPIARSVQTIATMDMVVTGNSHDKPLQAPEIRIGVPTEFFWENVDSRVQKRCEAILENLESAGFTIVRVPGPERELHTNVYEQHVAHINFELFQTLQEYINKHELTLDIDKDIIPNIQSTDVRDIFHHARLNPVTDGAMDKAVNANTQLKAAFEEYAKEHSLDCWIFPTIKIAVPRLDAGAMTPHNGGQASIFDFSIANVGVASVCDHPGITMPCGRLPKTGLPIGIEMDSLTLNDSRLIDIALTIESQGLLGH